jgi:hypothetical protein
VIWKLLAVLRGWRTVANPPGGGLVLYHPRTPRKFYSWRDAVRYGARYIQ